MKNNITLRVAVMVLLFFSIISLFYMCSGEKEKPINYNYQPETYGQYGPPCAKIKDLCDAPGQGYQIVSDSTGGWTIVYPDVDSTDIGIINIYPSADSLCFSLGDVSTGTVSNTICVPNDPFQCEALENCPLIQTIRDSIQLLSIRIETLTETVYTIDATIVDSTIYITTPSGIDTIPLYPCSDLAACDTFQQVINTLYEHIANDMDIDSTNEIQCAITGLNEVSAGDFWTIVLQNPDGSTNSSHTLSFNECIDVSEVLGENTKTSIYNVDINFDCIRGKIVCPNRDSTYFNTERGLVTEAIHIHYNPLTCVEIRDTVPHTNLSFDVLGGDSILIGFPDGTVDTFPIQHPAPPISECGETQTFQDVATQGSVIEDANYRTKIYYLMLDGEVCVIEDRDTFYRVNPDLLEAYVTNLYNTDLCCPNDSILTIQNENGLATAKVWSSYECGIPCVPKYDTIQFEDFGMQYSLLGVTAGGNATQIFQNQYGEGSVHIWQTTNCITQTGPTILTPNATFTLSLDLDCVADSLASRICCPSDTLLEMPSGIGYELLSYGCYPDCELSRDTIFFPQVPTSTITSTAPDANGIATFTVTNTKPDGSSVSCGECARIDFYIEIEGTSFLYETVLGLSGSAANSATSQLYAAYTESVLNHIPATDILFDCAGSTSFNLDSEGFAEIIGAQYGVDISILIRPYSYVGGGCTSQTSFDCSSESVNTDNFTEVCQFIPFEIESITGLNQVGIATQGSIGGATGEIIVGDTAYQDVIIQYENGVVAYVESDINCGFVALNEPNGLDDGFWIQVGTPQLVDTDTDCHDQTNNVSLTFTLDKRYECIALKVFDLDRVDVYSIIESIENISPAANDWEAIADGDKLDINTDLVGNITSIVPNTNTSGASAWLYFNNTDVIQFTYTMSAAATFPGRATFGQLKSCGCQ